jgi:PAS domain S-box-containing protein
MNLPQTSEAPTTRILVVEDDRVVALDLAGTLNELGYVVAGMATRGEEAVDEAKRLKPHLILMDVRLAGQMDGIQAAQAINQQRDVPVIYLTAHSDNETLRRATHAAAFGYIVKPFKSPELRCVIEIALHKHALDARLRENEQWLSTTLQSLAEAVIATDQSGRVRLFNRTAEQLTGWRCDEAAQHPVEDVLAVVDERTGAPAENQIRKALALRAQVSSCRASQLVSRSGQRVSVEECAAPIVDAFGNLLGGVLVLRDVTERRKQLQQIHELNAELEQRVSARTAQLEAANRELETFSYSVAHDLRAPLRCIHGFNQLLIDRYASKLDPDGVGYLNRVRSGTERMAQIIDALLSLARIGRDDLAAVEIDLSQLAATLVQEMNGSKVAGGPAMHVQIEPGMCAYADPKLLRIAMNNLLDNAYKFSSRRKQIQVHVGQCRDTMLPTYFVRDNGAGFDPDRAANLFSAFRRLHGDTEFPGTGIGLAIVHRVVARHGGTIWAEAKLGVGATFFFTLPSPLH